MIGPEEAFDVDGLAVLRPTDTTPAQSAGRMWLKGGVASEGLRSISSSTSTRPTPCLESNTFRWSCGPPLQTACFTGSGWRSRRDRGRGAARDPRAGPGGPFHLGHAGRMVAGGPDLLARTLRRGVAAPPLGLANDTRTTRTPARDPRRRRRNASPISNGTIARTCLMRSRARKRPGSRPLERRLRC